jgi:hypothetical protein
MLSRYARRYFSQPTKVGALKTSMIRSDIADVATALPVAQAGDNKVTELFEIGRNNNDSLVNFFNQNALALPVSTIIAKSEIRDYDFFLQQENFHKIVHSLELFEEKMVDVTTRDGKDFVDFKRKLYKMYELRNRSVYEHDAFVDELTYAAKFDTLCTHAALNGKVFKAKTLSPRKVKGIGAFAAAGAAYSNFTALSLMLGPTLPTLAMASAAVYGIFSINERQTIKEIEWVKDGSEFDGWFRFKVADSAFSSYEIIAHPKHTRTLAVLGDETFGAGDCKGQILHIMRFYHVPSGEYRRDVFTIPADAIADGVTMEWIGAHKDVTTWTLETFSQCVQRSFFGNRDQAKSVMKKVLAPTQSYLRS